MYIPLQFSINAKKKITRRYYRRNLVYVKSSIKMDGIQSPILLVTAYIQTNRIFVINLLDEAGRNNESKFSLNIFVFFKRRQRVALLKYFRTVVKWNLSVLPILKLPCIEKNHKKKNANPFFIFNGLFSETRIISLIFRKQSERKLNIFIQCIILLMGSNAFAECSRGFANPENRKWKDGNDIKGGL